MNLYGILHCLVSLFFAITFIQSGIDKVLNKEGNLSWFKSQFEPTIIKPIITPLFWWITIQELLLGLYMLAISIYSFAQGPNQYESYGLLYSLFVFIQLFTGQRIAKEYAGASGIIPYIIFALLALIITPFSTSSCH